MWLSFALAACPPEEPCRILPLGDSITDGYYLPGGYRVELEALLQEGGYDFDFVGGLRNGPLALEDRDHQGLSGWRIDQVDGIIGNRMIQLEPDLVLLHLGTNDVYQDAGAEEGAWRMSSLLRHILAIDPDTTILVAGILPARARDRDAQVRAFNTRVWGCTARLAAEGYDVRYVDHHTGFPTWKLIDQVHPNALGFRQMAETWYAALVDAW